MRPPFGRVIAAIGFAATLAISPAAAQAPADTSAVKQAYAHLKEGEFKEANALAARMKDPAARDLVMWLAIRLTPKDVGFDRVQAFIRQNPSWPSTGLLRRRAETLLLSEKRDARTISAFFGTAQPVSGEGMIALARALFASGKQAHAVGWLRRAWREEELTMSLEQEIIGEHGKLLSPTDHKLRSDRMFFAKKYDAANRSAARAGKDIDALNDARIAVMRRSANAKKLLTAVPAHLRKDPSYLFVQAMLRRKADDPKGAANYMLQAPRNAKLNFDTDDWWRETRIVARALLDDKNPKLAYRVAAEAPTPESPILKADQHFTAGWIALRYLNDPATAKKHFAHPVETPQPLYVSRALYWQGRAAEALHDQIGARAAFELAGRHHLVFYGQLARAKLKRHDLPFRAMPKVSDHDRAAFERNEVARALKLLYAASIEELVLPFYIDMIDNWPNTAMTVLLAEIAKENNDTRALVIIGKQGMDRSLPVDAIAFPLTGIPQYRHVGPPIEKAVVFAISRQESEFQPYVVSPAKAYGLMQVIRPTGMGIAKRVGIAFDFNKLQRDPVYNVTLGAAELGHLVQRFDGSYVLTFIGYNAGPGRATQWMAARGDPRGKQTEVILDWIERVPFTETRLYILRVLENLQVYRALLTNKRVIDIEADMARGSGDG